MNEIVFEVASSPEIVFLGTQGAGSAPELAGSAKIVFEADSSPEIVFSKAQTIEAGFGFDLMAGFIKGAKGDKGDPGADGLPGAPGTDGYTPVKGVDYFDGEPGADGAPGPQGIQGEKGDKGDPGEPASDVYAWAKAATKPAYGWGEITGKPTIVSAFTNDAGYLTSITKAQVEAVLTGAITSHTHSYQAPLTTSDLYLDTVNKRVGIGTVSPAYKLDVKGTATSDKISTDIGLNFNPVLRHGAFTASLSSQGAGTIPVGTHYYYVAYKTAFGQTELSIGNGGHTFTGMPGVLVTTTALDGKVNINVTASADPRVTNILIYRDVTNGNSYSDVKLIATISNVTQTYLDNIADTSRTGANAYTQENTTCMAFSVNGVKSGIMGISTTSLGLGNLVSITSGSNNTLYGAGLGTDITNGGANVLVGSFTGRGNISNCVYIGIYTGYQGTARSGSVGVGSNSLYSETVGYNTGIGYCSAFKITSGTYNLFAGCNAGNHASQKADVTNSIALGSGAYTTENNSVVLGNTSIVRTFLRGYLNVSSQTPASATAAGNAGDIAFDDNYIYRCIAANTWKRSPLTTW